MIALPTTVEPREILHSLVERMLQEWVPTPLTQSINGLPPLRSPAEPAPTLSAFQVGLGSIAVQQRLTIQMGSKAFLHGGRRRVAVAPAHMRLEGGPAIAGKLVALMRSLEFVGMTVDGLPWNSILQWFHLGRATRAWGSGSLQSRSPARGWVGSPSGTRSSAVILI